MSRMTRKVTGMKNETGICNDCQRRETCNLYKKNPSAKVFACGRFLMNETLKNIFDVLYKDGDKDG